jgi:hypothetical protein
MIISQKPRNLPEPALLLLFLRYSLLVFIDDLQSFVAFRGRSQILVAVLGDKNIILNSHTTNRIVLVEQVLVDEFRIPSILQEEIF